MPAILQQQVCDAFVELTAHCDSDALASSVLETLDKVLAPNSVALYRLHTHCGEPIGRFQFDRQQGWCFLVEDHVVPFSLPLQAGMAQNDTGLTITQTTHEHAQCVFIIEKPNMSEEEIRLCAAVCDVFANFNQLIVTSETDKLTGLLNRNSFERRLNHLLLSQSQQHETQLCQIKRRMNQPDAKLWLAILDIDHFKRINDKYGHVCGDEVLLKLAQAMRGFFRMSDLLFRFGGEEFLMIFSPASLTDVEKRLEAFREHIASLAFPMDEHVTVSVGFTELVDYEFPLTLIGRADQALYFAKAHGRNQVCFYEALADIGVIEPPVETGDVNLF